MEPTKKNEKSHRYSQIQDNDTRTVERLKQIETQFDDDPEMQHSRGVDVLCELLYTFGMNETVRQFRRLKKL